MESTAELRAAVAAVESRAGRRHYPVSLRSRLTSSSQVLRRSGASWDRISEELGVGASTLLRWCKQEDGRAVASSGGALVPVELLTSTRDAAPLGRACCGLVLTSPSGWRVEGLGVAEATALLEALA